MEYVQLGDITIEVELKDIKNIHLSVYPPNGKVRIAAPERMSLDTIRIYAISKLSWIKKQQTKLRGAERETRRDYVTKENQYLLGKRYLLTVIEENSKPRVYLKHNRVVLQVRPKTTRAKRKELIETWYREQLKGLIPKLISQYEKIMNIIVVEFAIRKMKTKWGTCNRGAGRIWFNLELAKKPIECIEYIVVHEMVHFLERAHNARFIAYMDKYLPDWKSRKQLLNRLPVSHVDWDY
ncbi:M48 family metallopeptidase [Pseudochryseolinea flava]|uniref:Metal-dependent hydrolase n=1 Tax=Pseudochryseolinea flava TaxID=2059302 RepID=A0A364Y624_9BACT|nr:SprT family zinc-dependent metalloprotease [Pseudochryseolinea flava]RAW01558.1 metal-dependent hydrolase [Pseudochryseolinea flava]